MAYNYEWPYLDSGEYNNDWLINRVKELTAEWVQVQSDWKDQQTAFDNLKAYIDDYFKNLDVQEEINTKLDEMAKDGTLLSIMNDTIVDSVNTWLNGHITNPSSPPLDDTFLLENAAAQSKAVGTSAYLWRGLQNEAITALTALTNNGSYGIVSSASSNITDIPSEYKGRSLTLVNIQSFNTYFCTQILFSTQDTYYPYVRFFDRRSPGNPVWTKIGDTGTVYRYNDEIYITEEDALISYILPGSYGITPTVSNLLNDVPTSLKGQACTLENIYGYNGNIITQKIYSRTTINRPFTRYITKSGNTWNPSVWSQLEIPTGTYTSPLSGKKWCVIGDSFTHGDFNGAVTPIIPSGKYAGERAVYPFLIGNRTNMDILDLSMNGLRIGGANGFSAEQLSNIPTESDFITIALGINDTPSHQNTPLGTIADTTTDTFYGAWNVLMTYIYNNLPSAHIGIIVTNGIAYTERAYADAIIEIAETWGVPYLNQNFGIQVPTMNRSGRSPETTNALVFTRRNQAFRVAETNSHPNAKAHEYESIYIENWLTTI